MVIRKAILDDLPGIIKLYDEFFRYNHTLQPSYYCAASSNEDYPKETIRNETADLLVAENDGNLIGMLHIRESSTPPYDAFVPHRFSEIVDFIVTESERNKGIGQKLLDAAKEWTAERNLDYIELFVLSDAKNENRFYKNQGFRATSETLRYSVTHHKKAEDKEP